MNTIEDLKKQLAEYDAADPLRRQPFFRLTADGAREIVARIQDAERQIAVYKQWRAQNEQERDALRARLEDTRRHAPGESSIDTRSILEREPWQVPLWDAINRFRDGNLVQREKAVVEVNGIVRGLLGRDPATGDAAA